MHWTVGLFYKNWTTNLIFNKICNIQIKYTIKYTNKICNYFLNKIIFMLKTSNTNKFHINDFVDYGTYLEGVVAIDTPILSVVFTVINKQPVWI